MWYQINKENILKTIIYIYVFYSFSFKWTEKLYITIVILYVHLNKYFFQYDICVYYLNYECVNKKHEIYNSIYLFQ